MARVWNAWRAQRHGAEPTARAVGPVRARPVPLGTVRAGSVRSTARFGMFTRTSPRVASRVVTAAFFDEDPAWDAVVAAEKAADETNTQHDARDGAALAMSDDFVASKPLEYERSVAAFVCLAVAAVVLSVPFGFVRWNLSTLAPLVWWQLGLSTGVGTLMAAPLVYACTLPAIRARCNLPVLARASFGVRGGKIADLGRGILGLVLFTLITLAGGEAVLGAASALANNGVLYDGVFADPDSFAGLVERLVAYVAFWAAQCAVLVNLRPDKRLMWCARGGSALVCFHFIRAVAAGFREAALLDLPLAPLVPEFWTHAVLTAGVWFTLAALLPDYARKCVNEDGYLKAQAFWLPLLAGCVAVAALGVTGESSPVACLLSVAAACLVTNATATSVGAVSAIRAWKPQGAKRSAFIVALVALIAAPLAMTWQQVIAASSWAVGIGSLLVAPAIGVVLAHYWLRSGRSIDAESLYKRDDTNGKYWYQGGVSVRAVAALFVGAAPNLAALAAGVVASLKSTGQMRLNLYIVNSEYSSLVGMFLAAGTYVASLALFPLIPRWMESAQVLQQFVMCLEQTVALFAFCVTFVLSIPGKLAAKFLEFQAERTARAAAIADTESNSTEAQAWIDGWKDGQPDVKVTRAMRTVDAGSIGRRVQARLDAQEAEERRKLDEVMKKPDVVLAKKDMDRARKEATDAVAQYEEATKMSFGADRDLALKEARRLVEASYQLKVKCEMHFEALVYKYMDKIIRDAGAPAEEKERAMVAAVNTIKAEARAAAEAAKEALKTAAEAAKRRREEEEARKKEFEAEMKAAKEAEAKAKVEAAAKAKAEAEAKAKAEVEAKAKAEAEAKAKAEAEAKAKAEAEAKAAAKAEEERKNIQAEVEAKARAKAEAAEKAKAEAAAKAKAEEEAAGKRAAENAAKAKAEEEAAKVKAEKEAAFAEDEMVIKLAEPAPTDPELPNASATTAVASGDTNGALGVLVLLAAILVFVAAAMMGTDGLNV